VVKGILQRAFSKIDTDKIPKNRGQISVQAVIDLLKRI
jgi:hypothetical protein